MGKKTENIFRTFFKMIKKEKNRTHDSDAIITYSIVGNMICFSGQMALTAENLEHLGISSGSITVNPETVYVPYDPEDWDAPSIARGAILGGE